MRGSSFDFLTFGFLLKIAQATPAEFRTGWFVESLLTELVIALVVRSRRPFLPVARLIGFVPLPVAVLLALSIITVLYVGATESLKKWFYRNHR